MNLGRAVAVCLYELIREGKGIRGPEKVALAASAEVDRITKMLFDALRESGFLDVRRVADSEERIRRVVRRLKIQERAMR